MSAVCVVVGDVGGTNSRLRSVKLGPDGDSLIAEKTYSSTDSASFKDIVQQFLDEEVRPAAPDATVLCACFAVAGPVIDNAVRLTNLAWPAFSGDELSLELGIPRVVIVNDFTAAAYGCLTLKPSEVHTLRNTRRVRGRPIAVVGPGTGLGQAYMTWSNYLSNSSDASTAAGAVTGAYTAWPSEGGHSDFAPRNDVEVRLVRYLAAAIDARLWHRCDASALQIAGSTPIPSTSPSDVSFIGEGSVSPVPTVAPAGENTTAISTLRSQAAALDESWFGSAHVRVSVERVISGTGIPHLYNFILTQLYPSHAAHAVAAKDVARVALRVCAEAAAARGDAELASMADAAAGTDPLPSEVHPPAAYRAMQLFVSSLGSECGNMCLKLLPTGGLFIPGGIPSQILPLLIEDDRLVRNLTQKGRLSDAIASIPVYVVLREVEVGIRGVQLLALRETVRLLGVPGAFDAFADRLPGYEARLASVSEPFGGLVELP